MTHRRGKRINPLTAPALLSERTMQLMLTPLHMAAGSEVKASKLTTHG